MTLVDCPECATKISDKANQCVHCGLPTFLKADTNLNLLIHYADQMDKNWSLVSSVNKSTAARFIWYVAICGYAIINMKYFYPSLQDLETNVFLLLFLPWIITAFVSILGEFFLSFQTMEDARSFSIKSAIVDSAIANQAPVTIQEVFIRMDTDENAVKSKRKVELYSNIVKYCERLALPFLFCSLTFSVIVNIYND
jgi:hypothetical protein